MLKYVQTASVNPPPLPAAIRHLGFQSILARLRQTRHGGVSRVLGERARAAAALSTSAGAPASGASLAATREGARGDGVKSVDDPPGHGKAPDCKQNPICCSTPWETRRSGARALADGSYSYEPKNIIFLTAAANRESLRALALPQGKCSLCCQCSSGKRSDKRSNKYKRPPTRAKAMRIIMLALFARGARALSAVPATRAPPPEK